MNGPPDWQDGECCFRCRTQFSLVARKHHCRNCGNIFCAKCSSQQIPLPKLNIEKSVRVCDTCYEKISSKNHDPLALALGPEDKKSKSESATKQKSKSSSTSSSKSGASASAPSEQELKEEEELQLALALSLSETPTKVSFPDYRHLEEPQISTHTRPSTSGSDRPTSSLDDIKATKTNNVNVTTINDPITPAEVNHSATISEPDLSVVQTSTATTANSVASQQPLNHQQTPPDYDILERDQELFKYIREVHSTLEVFNNRLEACKLRNRPISKDAAIQSTFIKLNSEIQPKLTEYINTYEEERSVYERLQDKLSQIADARAALDDLRQEHQEKLRQIAAEAEKQRQSQLASKLEAMRQKKSEMMQYQRELALQRIREQEMIQQHPAQQQVVGEVQPPPIMSATVYQQPVYDPTQVGQAHGQVPPISSHVPVSIAQQQWQPANGQSIQYQHTYVPQVSTAPSAYSTPNHPQSYNSCATQQHSAPVSSPAPAIDRSAIAQLEKQYLPDAKPDEEAPLISFDD